MTSLNVFIFTVLIGIIATLALPFAPKGESADTDQFVPMMVTVSIYWAINIIGWSIYGIYLVLKYQ